MSTSVANQVRGNAASAMTVPTGPALADAEFDFIRHVISENAGIVLGPHKRQLVQGRLARRLRELGLSSYEAYCNHVRESGPEELAEYMIPEALKRNQQTRRLRIWSAGCSSGEEAYCLAMTAAACMPTGVRWDLKILATDIDSDMVAMAQGGIYPVDRLAAIPEAKLRRFFRRGTGENEGNARVNPEIARMI